MKRTVLILTALMLCASLLFIGCSKPAKEADYSPGSAHYGEAYNDKTDAAPVSDPAEAPDAGNMPAGRKIIRNADLSVQTLEFDSFLGSVSAKLNELGGYVESRSVRDRDYYWRGSQQLRSAEMVLRVPAEKLDEFLSAVNGLGNVISSSENTQDVTESYMDTEAKLSSLRTEYDTLLGLLEKAQDLQQILTLQERLTSVRYEMESLESRLMSYDSLIAFSKVTMTVSEVERETPVENESFGQEVSRRFKESLQDVGDGLRTFAAWFIGDFPIIFVWLLIIVVIPLVIVLIVLKSIRKRKNKKAAEAYKTASQEKPAE